MPLYKHYKTGNLYEFKAVVHAEKDGTDLVVYSSVASGRLWARPAEEFFGQVRVSDSEAVRRFAPVLPPK